MKIFKISVVVLFACMLCAVLSHAVLPDPDWLIDDIKQPVRIQEDATTKTLAIDNGLIQRAFRTSPNLATVQYKNLTTSEEFIRGVKPEAAVSINGREYKIGGLQGQPDYAFLKQEWLDEMVSDTNAFQYQDYSVSEIEERIPWKRTRYSEDLPWPPKGKEISFRFTSPESDHLQGLEIAVHYAIYQGIPVLSKWISIRNGTTHPVRIDAVTTEILAVVERESDVERTRSTKPRPTNILVPNDLADMTYPRIHLQSDYSFCGMSYKSADQTTFWAPDEQYSTQVNYSRQWPHLLTSHYPYGPAIDLPPHQVFTSFRTFELLHDSDDYERRGLAVRKMQRILAPWCTENPLMLHLRYSDSASIRRAVDQCVETGFEMIILSFGSGINMESTDPEYLARIKADMDYAHEKGIEIGGYSLLSSRNAGPKYNVIDPATGKDGAYFGHAPCLVSEWGEKYFTHLKNFIVQTGCNLLEHDGSYPGDPCASTLHKGHRGLDDSQYLQHKKITDFYRWCRSEGIYLNVPDYYFLSGSNKTGMGYRETNWSLPRELQILHSRQNIYDGTWFKAPSMGWMFVPLVEYHGGGKAATIEPLHDHLTTYEAFLAGNLGSGVQACYRGPRLYDTEETKQLVKKWVDFYKKYRSILDSDIIHLRRPDGRDWDGILHVNPTLKTRGFAMFFNPTSETLQRKIKLPLYYTGLSKKAKVREKEGRLKTYKLNRDYTIELSCTIPPQKWTWFVIEE